MSEPSVAPGWQSRRRALFDEYERVALVLFAERGFRSVTIEEVAEAAGVSARTLFRYFPTKDDYLLAFARRELEITRDAIAALAPDPSPLPAVWTAVWARFEEADIDLDALTLWRSAASDAPDVVNRVRGSDKRPSSTWCLTTVPSVSAWTARWTCVLGCTAESSQAPTWH